MHLFYIFICFLYFLCVAVVTCYLYTIYVKGRINSVKVSIVDSGLAIANVSEYRRSVSNNIFYELEVSPEELLKKIRNSFAGYENPGYLYDLGPYMISDGKCIKVTTKGDNFCDDIVSSIRVINEFERGIISLKNKCYVYYAHPIAKRTSLISVVDPERYLSLIRNQSGEREDIYVSFNDINDNDVDDYYNVFQTSWFIESLNDDGTFEPIKNAGTVGSDAEANKIGKTNFSFEKGETKNLILYCIFTAEEVENAIIALNFHLRNSPFIGPLAIIHEPETN